MILGRFGEWSCSICDHNEYPGTALVPTQTWWKGRKPKVCWRCVATDVAHCVTDRSAAFELAAQLVRAGRQEMTAEDIRQFCWLNGISTDWVSEARFPAMVRRAITGLATSRNGVIKA